MGTLPIEDEIDPGLLRRISRLEYDRMAEGGWFAQERVELLEGLVFDMSPILPAHAATVGRVTRALVPLLDRAEVRVQQPLVASDWSEPEPDVAVVALGNYDAEHPQTALLLVEVSLTSLQYDRGIKRRVYARAGVPEYWIVNLVDRVVEVYADPTRGAYASLVTVQEHETLSPAAFPDLVIPVASLLP